MKFEKGNEMMNEEHTLGFITISDLGNAQQGKFNIKMIKKLSKLADTLEKLGFYEITLTLENGCPLIIGSKKNGIALAPRIHD